MRQYFYFKGVILQRISSGLLVMWRGSFRSSHVYRLSTVAHTLAMNASTPLNPRPPTTWMEFIILQDQPVCNCSTLITPFPHMIFWFISCIWHVFAWPRHQLNIFTSKKGEEKKQDWAVPSPTRTKESPMRQKRALSLYFNWVLYLPREPSINTQPSKEASVTDSNPPKYFMEPPT